MHWVILHTGVAILLQHMTDIDPNLVKLFLVFRSMVAREVIKILIPILVLFLYILQRC